MEKRQNNKLPTELARNKQGQIYLLGNNKGVHWAGAKSLSNFSSFVPMRAAWRPFWFISWNQFQTAYRFWNTGI